uniref:Putative secreted protein n=1 Tax=Anopheles darlingi TaxID=43151 RepID=A0A2M4D4U1_ANODA
MLTETFSPSGLSLPPFTDGGIRLLLLLLLPPPVFISDTFCSISRSDFGALIREAPRYVTPLKMVQSWSMSDSSSSVSSLRSPSGFMSSFFSVIGLLSMQS